MRLGVPERAKDGRIGADGVPVWQARNGGYRNPAGGRRWPDTALRKISFMATAARQPHPIGANPEAEKLISYPAFDWLRFVLASVVVLVHEDILFPGPIDGELAVDVFFALSGWLIGGILLRTDRREMPRFFFNRATRIWIPYAVAITVLYGFAAIYEGVSAYWAKYLFYDATFTHQLFTRFPQASTEMPLRGSGNQFWSISVEEQFYLLAPALMMLVPWGKRLMPWVLLAATAFWFKILGAPIVLGVIAAILQRDYGDWHARGLGRLLVLALTLAVFAVLFLYPQWFLMRGLFSVGVVLSLAMPGIRRPLPVFLGGISFPLYLNHWIGAFVAHGVMRHAIPLPEAVLPLLAYPASLVIGAAAYLTVDRRVLMRRQTWFTPRLGKALGVAAYMLVSVGVVGGMAIG